MNEPLSFEDLKSLIPGWIRVRQPEGLQYSNYNAKWHLLAIIDGQIVAKRWIWRRKHWYYVVQGRWFWEIGITEKITAYGRSK